jgi:hypothetical protein
MTMLIHTRDRFEPGSFAATSRNGIEADAAAAARREKIKLFCIRALSVLAALGALTAVIALKAAIYYWRFH